MEAKHEQQIRSSKFHKSILDNIIEVESHFDVEALENDGVLKLGDRIHISSINEVFKVISKDTLINEDSRIIKGVKYNYLSRGKRVNVSPLESEADLCKRNSKVTEVETLDALLNLGDNEVSVGAIINIIETGHKYRVLSLGHEVRYSDDLKSKNFMFRKLE